MYTAVFDVLWNIKSNLRLTVVFLFDSFMIPSGKRLTNVTYFEFRVYKREGDTGCTLHVPKGGGHA